MSENLFDEIGEWTEIKLEIIEEYANAYTKILSNQIFKYVYIDAFAGFGKHISKKTGLEIAGSPNRALSIDKKFQKYFFIDIKKEKTDELNKLKKQYTKINIEIYTGDCNEILLNNVFPTIPYKDYWRALCLLDPYGLHLEWKIIEAAGDIKNRQVEIFLNFPVMDINRTAIWKHPENVLESNITRMTRFWGDESWKDIGYKDVPTLFGVEKEKQENLIIAEGFRKRLKEVAGFKYVPEPLPMKNSKGSIVYYLFFASQNETGAKIAEGIFNKYKNREK